MRYIKFTMSNGYCGCDQEEYEAFEDGTSDSVIDTYAAELLPNMYCFWDPDSRFVGDDEEDYDESVEAYQEECNCYWEEVDEDEYNENVTHG